MTATTTSISFSNGNGHGHGPDPSLSVLSDESLYCRVGVLGHSWDFMTDYTLVKVKGAPRVITRHVKCARCETEKYDTYSVPDFERVSTKYVYSEGYLLKGLGQVHGADVRAEVFRRVVGEVPRR